MQTQLAVGVEPRTLHAVLNTKNMDLKLINNLTTFPLSSCSVVSYDHFPADGFHLKNNFRVHKMIKVPSLYSSNSNLFWPYSDVKN